MGTVVDRVRYREGQRLRAADLTAEQNYLVMLERRHNTTLHSPGIVLGLEARQGFSAALEHHAGVAVDSDGRLLLLERARPVAPAAAGRCIDSWLIYCEAPRRTRRTGFSDCGPQAFDRWHEFVQVVDIEVAPGDPPAAPLAGAVYLGRTRCNATHDIRYAALPGAQVSGPRGDVSVSVGPETGRDRDGFRIRGVGQPWLAIDRLGNNRFNGTVTLSDYRACARLELPGQQMLIVQAQEPGSAGERMHLRIRPVDTRGIRSLSIEFLSGRERLDEPIVLQQDQNPAAVFKAASLDRVALRVERALQNVPAAPGAVNPAQPVAASQTTSAQFFEMDADVALNPCGGMLQLEAWPAPPGAVPPTLRGCLPALPVDNPVREPNGVSFTAMAETPKTPPLPGVYAVQTGTAALPAQQFRLDLGEKRDNNPSVRLSLGTRENAQSPFREWLHIDGRCGLSIAGPVADRNNAPTSLQVRGTVRLGPIKPDATDPIFASLLVQAFLAGLQQSVQASTVVNLAFNPAPPALIETGKPWQYTLVITNGSGQAITADGVVEQQTVTGQPPLIKTVSGQLQIGVGGQASFQVKHDPNITPAGSLAIEARVFGKIGNTRWWRSATHGPIQVVERPTADLDGFPDSVPPGATFDVGFDIRNDASIALTLDAVTMAEGNAAPQNVPGTPAPLAAGASKTFGPTPHAGIANDLKFTVKAGYTWTGGAQSNIEASKTVRVRRDLRATFTVPGNPTTGSAWKFDLRLKNESTEDVTLKVLRHRLSGTGFAATAYAAIPFPAGVLEAGDHVSFTDINGIPVPATATGNKVRLEIDIEYDRGTRTFHPDPEVQEIPI